MYIVVDLSKVDDLCKQASLYALGVLDGDELRLFERHLDQGCSNCNTELNRFQPVVNQLSHIPPVVPSPPSIRSALLQRIKNEPLAGQPENHPCGSDTEKSEAGFVFIKAADNRWQEILPGIKLKPFFVDNTQNRMTALIRMEPNTTYAAHRHTAPEELYVLEGTCFCGGQLLRPGDYHRAETGSIHDETSTKDGCLMFIIFSPENEMLDYK
ncbi:MAG: hypothetical protein NMNS01_18810 [Nitrosomonas sp.]|nr:MAG: hypothetical protein NMNS01_18810 [Nitrosomonas sp.]